MSSSGKQLEQWQFKPGGPSGNPSGRPKVPAEILEARKISQFEFERIVNKFLFMTDEEFDADLARKDVTKFERLLGGIITKAIARKDEKKAEWLLARTLGKMRDKLDVTSNSQRVEIKLDASAMGLDSPSLTMEQLESFESKVEKIKQELKAKELLPAAFEGAGDADTIDVPAAAVADDAE